MTASPYLLSKIKNHDLLKTDCLINGQWIAATSGERFEVLNPANGELLAAVPRMGYDETISTIEHANNAWSGWRKKLAIERAKIMLKWSSLLRQNQEDLATIMALEMGKPISQSRGEVEYSASFIDWYANLAQSHFGETIPATQAGRRETTWKQPVGVVAAITPWNFPAAMAARKLAPAIAVGCPTILKPAELSPLSALALAHFANEAGMPAGIINVITGQASEIGRAFTDSKTVRKLSFTGSTAVGKKLYAASANTVKQLSMELGGNAPFIVFDDADLKAALVGLELSKFRNTGQTCVCANRIFVQEKVFDQFRDMIIEKVKTMRTGDPLDNSTDVGCLVSHAAFEKVTSLVEAAVAAGAKILIGGSAPEGLSAPYYLPTVIENVTHDMAICHEEIFGPIAVLIKFKTEEEVLAMANDTEYGLASYFYTQDYQRIFRLSEKLEYGMVGVNLGHISSIASPFGGYKQSGIGRESSTYGLDEFMETKYVAFGGLE
jgi:succinate-semialdehyde dehydrogenase/glutarate-semialdehyde dehydrogenase